MGTWQRGAVVVVTALGLAVLVLPRAAVPTAPPWPAAPPPTERIEYVALGDSYTAGPGLPAQHGHPSACRRSSGNYPARVAAALDARLIDVSCGGARTRDLVRPQRLNDGSRTRPQLEVVDRRTDLVTLGVGANEFGIFARIFGRCARQPTRDRTCGDLADLRRDARRVERTTRRSVRQIRDRAPAARIVVVGYPRMLPSGAVCGQVPFTVAETRRLRTVWARVSTSLRRAARKTDVEYVDPYPASNTHHACSRRPWVNGTRPAAKRGTAFHPTPRGMAGMSRLVLRTVSAGVSAGG